MANGKMQVDAALVRELAELLKETDLSEIEVADGERRVRVARQILVTANVGAPSVAPPATLAEPAAVAAVDLAKQAGVVPSPMVGTAYTSSEPGKPPFVSVGSMVKEGDTLLIVEAMKVMNPIIAPRAGKVTKIFIENAQPIEFGEPLMIIE